MSLASTIVLLVEQTPPNGCRQHLGPQGEFQLSPASPEALQDRSSAGAWGQGRDDSEKNCSPVPSTLSPFYDSLALGCCPFQHSGTSTGTNPIPLASLCTAEVTWNFLEVLLFPTM